MDGLPATGLGIRDDDRPPRAPDYSSLQGLPDYRAHLARTLADGTSANGVFGAKIMFNQLPEVQALAGTLPEYRGLAGPRLLGAMIGAPEPLRFVWARRRDTVRQAVSMWRAIQTRSWRGDEGGEAGEGREPQYHYEAIEHLVKRFQDDDRGWAELFAVHRIEPLQIAYEDDLEADRDRTVARALQYIGVAPPPRAIDGDPIARQADALSEEWVAAYHRDRADRRGQLAAAPEGAPRR
jgi:LPS sulfotransferase NodH